MAEVSMRPAAGVGVFERKVFGVPAGAEPLAVARLAMRDGGVVACVTLDDHRLRFYESALRFFAPELRLITLPAWDCLPYDPVSPAPSLVGRRLAALSELSALSALSESSCPAGEGGEAPLVVLTTVAAACQRLPPRSFLRREGASFPLKVGAEVGFDALLSYLSCHGYDSAEAVREPCAYARRGGLVDVWPPGASMPLRADFNGDTLESLRRFDAASQRTLPLKESSCSVCILWPAAEALLDAEAIARFRSGYRALAPGRVWGEDALYRSLSAGQRVAGMERYLPLFHERLEDIFCWLPARARLVVADGVEEAMVEREQLARSAYDARRHEHGAVGGRGASGGERLLPPSALYLTAAEWRRRLATFSVFRLSPYGSPGGESSGGEDFGARALTLTASVESLRATLASLLPPAQASGLRVLCTAASLASRKRLFSLMAACGYENAAEVESWREACAVDASRVALAVLPVPQGFTCADMLVVGEQDLFGRRGLRRPRRARKARELLAAAETFCVGDAVVHEEYGVGRFEGLETMDLHGAPHDCLKVAYEGDGLLYVPVWNIAVLSRYGHGEHGEHGEHGGHGVGVKLDSLSGVSWRLRKARVAKRIKEMAQRLVRLAARRRLGEAPVLEAPRGAYEEFCARFPHVETEDQERAIEDVCSAVASSVPMERLLCGDAGVGKTEVALRAAFVAVSSGMQAALLTPTTLLARQHGALFESRFRGFGFKVAVLSRLSSLAEARRVREGLASGAIDVVVATHTLLGESVSFGRLGLLVVDEEQHFGVGQKERIKELAAGVHVLSLTATPIPRTLHMALSGLRDMSLIATPPVDRIAIRTFVLPWDAGVVARALVVEKRRGGRSFYIVPRIDDIGGVADFLGRSVGHLRVAVAHGGMAASRLEDAVGGFYEGRCDVLLCTSIVESGLDVPGADTLIVHRADLFGLAQLYQLRGRVGRGGRRAWAYLTVPCGRLPDKARRRLEILHNLDTVGAGFAVAAHDLDLRGAGNVLGEEQSGHVREVGVELYQQMVAQAVAAARSVARDGEHVEHVEHGEHGEHGKHGAVSSLERLTMPPPRVRLGVTALLPRDYVADLGLRLTLYRRLGALEDGAAVDDFTEELVDRFGKLPEAASNLLEAARVGLLCRRAGVVGLDAGKDGAVVRFAPSGFSNVAGLLGWVASKGKAAVARPDQSLLLRASWRDEGLRLGGVLRLVSELAELAELAETVSG